MFQFVCLRDSMRVLSLDIVNSRVTSMNVQQLNLEASSLDNLGQEIGDESDIAHGMDTNGYLVSPWRQRPA